MTETAHTAQDMISAMTPHLRPECYVFATACDPTLAAHAIASFREDEGLSLILPYEVAADAELDTASPMRCITLNVYSSLEGVGLTAAVATHLAQAGIACNMVAAFHHDHAFVPALMADQAMQVLTALQNNPPSFD